MWSKGTRLRVLMSHRVHCAPDWTWDSRHNKWTGYHLWTIAGGRGRFETPEGTFDLRTGDCFVLDTTETYLGTGDPAHPLVVPAVNFQVLDARGRVRRLDRGEVPLYRRMDTYAFVEQLLNRSVDAHAAGDLRAAEHWLRGALVEIYAQDHAPAGAQLEPYARVIDEICARVRDDPGAPYAVGDLAAQVGCTGDHFIRLFRSRVGCTPIEYVVRARTDAAKRLLRFSSHSVKRIADLLGYSDQYFFSRQFKKRTGTSPSAYRSG